MTLFDLPQPAAKEGEPLAARMRPATLEEFVGQESILGPGRLLRRAIEADRLFSSIILWGPPGSGKTTLARVIAARTDSAFESLSAVMAGLPDLRQVIGRAREHRASFKRRTILFVDEVHRWNKAQQDALLPLVENGTFVFIGATTENPYFEVIGPLVSRSRVFELKALSEAEILILLRRALADRDRGYGARAVAADPAALEHLARLAGGDARNALNALELAVESTTPAADGTIHIDLGVAQESIQRRALLYDRDGDAHYDTISAFIKSVRGSDPDAALYWLARMLRAGEDPRFILRRLVILAGEDIGLAEPQGLLVATAAAQAFDYIGMPEGIYPIVEATLFLATAPKSNSAGAYFAAQEALEDQGIVDVPRHLQDSSRDAQALGHGQGYEYPHNHAGHHIGQLYLPAALAGRRFYDPSAEGYEAGVRERLERWRAAQAKALAEKPPADDASNPAPR
jgi:putative ATPase